MEEALPGFAVPLDAKTPAFAPETLATDEQLMLLFCSGSNEAFGDLFSRYKQPLFAFFRRRVTEPALAEELAQETWVAILRASSRYEPRSGFRTYLYAIGFNIQRSHRRKTAFRAVFFGGDSADHEPATQSTIDTEVVLREAMSKLERHDREILMLREFEQLSYTEIAELLGTPLNTVRSRLFRARTTLRNILAAPAPRSATRDFTEIKERA
jgi:RNA polymerase sigma factor (sigma-70 family)